MSGVESTGFVKKTLDDILTDVETDMTTNIQSGLNFASDAVLGQINGILADAMRELWDVQESIYNAFNPDAATGQSLDNLAALAGITRSVGTRSSVVGEVNLDAGTSITIGSFASQSSNDQRWFNTTTVTNSEANQDSVAIVWNSEDAGTFYAPSGSIDTIVNAVTGWNANVLVKNAAAETYVLVDGQTLTVKVDGGAEQTATFNTADFAAIGAATAAEVAAVIDTDISGASSFVVGDGTFVGIESDDAGSTSSIEVTGGTANTELSFPTDLRSGFNTTDATLGTAPETDSALRQRRESALHTAGAATPDAIRSAVLTVTGITDAVVFENTRDITVDGLDPHSIEVVADGATGASAALAQKIWDFKPAGIGTNGGLSDVATDANGDSQTVKFSDPTLVPIYFEVHITTDTGLFGGGDESSGRQLLKDALVALGQTRQTISEDVFNIFYQCEVKDLAGVTNVTELYQGIAASPTLEDDISISPREKANVLDANITIGINGGAAV